MKYSNRTCYMHIYIGDILIAAGVALGTPVSRSHGNVPNPGTPQQTILALLNLFKSKSPLEKQKYISHKYVKYQS